MKIENTVSQAIEISLRIFGIWPNTSTFNRILTMMANNWEKCSDTKFSMLITRCNAKLSQRFVNMTVILYLTAVIFFSSKILVKHDNGDTASNVSTRLLILDMDLPFDANRRFIYESIIIVQFLHLVLCSEAIGLLNALLINLILHISGQIDILRKSVMDIFPKEGNGRLSRFVVQKIIKKHQEIIIFSEHIEDLYSYIAMVLFVTDTLIICCLGFTIVAAIGRPDALNNIIKTLLFYFLMNSEAFIFCFAGEYLSAKSKSIGDAAYDSLWYESDSKDSRIILFLIMRSQNQLTITIGKIMNLSLDRFGSIIKASASYISVLFAM
ncbi:odorant receptor 22c-like isoform X5 [Temnothorax curvispinosus]|uniref:Odorant receptor 22c-like isoform X5 n=1 Tax=Temnothorax curvispinosus TaxID=300111 RepID=A0A6J1Q7B8_9HYME|nr:odorant receptor 22c-like isoform X5 [Temnothorax curvispinosus]